jgi:predicted nucleotide-binding protein
MPQPKNPKKPKDPAPAAAQAPAVRKAEFPKFTLEDALALPNALQRNGGQPLPAIDMATAIERSPGSSAFRQIGAAASAYGLISGSYKTAFSMREAGQAITQPTDQGEAAHALVAAALTPETFRLIYEYYKGKKFPERQFFENTVVREFGVNAKQAAQCCQVFEANMQYVGLIKLTPGGNWLALEATPQATAVTLSEDEVEDAEADAARTEVEEEGIPVRVPDAAPKSPAEPVKRRRPNRIFIGHGKNKKPLVQLTKTLDNLGIPYAVAEDEANAGRPISQKVRDTMESCGAAILIFSADIEYFDADQKPVWKSSENVANELGAAAVMYDNRIILFKEEAVDLASNYSGIGYIPFEKDNLDAKVNDLLRELFSMKIIRVTSGDDE